MASATISIGYNQSAVVAGVAQTERTMSNAAKNISGSFSGVGAKIGGFLAGAAIAENAKETISHFAAIQDAAAKLNTTASSIQHLDIMAGQSGTDVETVVSSLLKLNRALGDPSNQKASEAFKTLGIDMQTLAKLAPEQQIVALAKAFQKSQETGQGFSEIFDLVGKSGAALLPILRADIGELQAMNAEGVLSDADVARLAAIDDQLDRISRTLKQSMGTALVAVDSLWSGLSERAAKTAEGMSVFWDSLAGGSGLSGAQAALQKYQVELKRIEVAEKAAADAKGKGKMGNIDPAAIAEAKGPSDAEKKTLANQAEKRQHLISQLAIMQAQADGQNKLADALAREMKLRERSVEIQNQLGISAENARAIAEKEAALQDRIDGKKNGKAGGIHGFSAKRGDKVHGMTGLGGEKFEGLERYKRLQAGGHFERKFAAFDDGFSLDTLTSPKRLAMAKAREKAGGGMKGVDAGTQKEMVAILERIAASVAPLGAL